MNNIEQPTDFKEFLLGTEPKIFLIGAGCSVDPPSCLPTGRAMMEAIIRYCCPQSEVENILQYLNILRFEGLVDILSRTIDPNLKLIDYYSQCDKPNTQHFFLAEMLRRGHSIWTNNFDFLIEYAIQQSRISTKDFHFIVTNADSKKTNAIYDSSDEFKRSGKCLFMKLHGSTKNIFTGEATRDSLITTLEVLGSDRDHSSVFRLSGGREIILQKDSHYKSLIVMGYSGSDDFDIIPTLKRFDFRQIIWLNHIKTSGEFRVKEIVEKPSYKDKVDLVLWETQQITRHRSSQYRKYKYNRGFRVDVNITWLISNLLPRIPPVNPNNFSINPTDWLYKNFPRVSEFQTYDFALQIFFFFRKYDDVLRCAQKILQLIGNRTDLEQWRASILDIIGRVHFEQGNLQEAMNHFQRALSINKQVSNYGESTQNQTNILVDIANIYYIQGDLKNALKYYKTSLKTGYDHDAYSRAHLGIGNIFFAKSNYDKALDFYRGAVSGAQHGNLKLLASALNAMARVYRINGDFSLASRDGDEAVSIARQLGDQELIKQCTDERDLRLNEYNAKYDATWYKNIEYKLGRPNASSDSSTTKTIAKSSTVSRECPNCGTEISNPEAVFCSHCGSKLS